MYPVGIVWRGLNLPAPATQGYPDASAHHQAQRGPQQRVQHHCSTGTVENGGAGRVRRGGRCGGRRGGRRVAVIVTRNIRVHVTSELYVLVSVFTVE